MKSLNYNAGLFALALRLVVGWTYFSAFWRRTILADKLDPELAGYIGVKFNHFLPNALGIKPIIQYLVENPDILWVSMVSFTIIEGIVGLFIMLGLFTRLMSIGVFGLALGILLGSGWIGTTCLDEWQIGVLGIASGFLIFLSGSSKYSIDYYFMNRKYSFTEKKWFQWLGSGSSPFRGKTLNRFALWGSFGIFGLTLLTNQIFHGGLWGTLHNKSVKPKIEISEGKLENETLKFDVYRTEGVDVYGAWIIAIEIMNEKNELVHRIGQNQLPSFNPENISNHYVAKVVPGAHSLVIPLGAKATLSINSPEFIQLKNKPFAVKITDISGANWTQQF